MAKEIWTITTNYGHGPSYSISFRTPYVEMAIDKLIMSELVVPAPGIKKNIDECKDTEKVTVQNVGNFDRNELEQLYWKIHATLTAL